MEYKNIWADRNYPLILMLPVVEATIFGFAKINKQSKIISGGNYWENCVGQYFYNNQGTGKTVDDLVANKKLFYQIAEGSLRKAIELRKFAEKKFSKDLSNIKTEKFLDTMNVFYSEFKEFYAYGTIQSIMGYRDDNKLYKEVDKILKKKTKNIPEKFAEYFQILTSAKKRTKNQDFDLEILKLADKCKAGNLKSVASILRKYNKKLEILVKKYKFLSFDFNYSAKWDVKHFAALVLEKSKVDAKNKIQKNVNYENLVKKDFENVKNKLSLNKTEIEIFNLMGDLGYYKWAREFEFQKAWYLFCEGLNELGKRLGLDKKQNKWLLPDEYDMIFSGDDKIKQDYKKIIMERMKNSLVLVSKSGTKVYSGKKAIVVKEKLKFSQENIINQLNELKGMSARHGFARGKVKIINSTADMEKMIKGDILVARTTYPKLFPAMKKAAAIITDEGGITCHAAIVARELGVPCIVGVKTASKTLKDGDLVEVVASESIVRIINK